MMNCLRIFIILGYSCIIQRIGLYLKEVPVGYREGGLHEAVDHLTPINIVLYHAVVSKSRVPKYKSMTYIPAYMGEAVGVVETQYP